MRFLISIVVVTIYLSANFIDSDFDGVEDSKDRCPNSDFFVIVDRYGCSVKKLTKPTKANYSLSLGYQYSKDDLIQNSYIVNFSFSYKNFSGYIESSRFNIDNESDFDDTTIALYYKIDRDNLEYVLGAGIYLPTGDESGNRSDYFASLKINYFKGKFNSYISYTHTFMRDSNSYDINSYSFGIGWQFSESLYSSISYSLGNSIYDSSTKTNYLNIFTNYYLTNNTYMTLSLTKGLNSSSVDKSLALFVGYDF